MEQWGSAKEIRRYVKTREKQLKGKNIPQEAYRTTMENGENVAEFDDLHTCFFTDRGVVRSVSGVSFAIPMGKTVAVVGESGCGKSVTSLSLMGLLQRPQGQITGGALRLNLGDHAVDIAKTPEQVMQQIRGRVVSMIFQEPMTALNPVLTVGAQVAEAVQLHDPKCSTAELARKRVAELLERVGIPDPERVARSYPHALSGGMRQRVMIAMALAGDPRLIIADEPTTALDVTIQKQILELLGQVKEQSGCSVLLITHDLGVVAAMADLVVVMYAGRVVEQGTVQEIFKTPAHPYTLGLMAAKPVVGKPVERLYSIPGRVPDPIELPPHCYFRQRCDHAGEDCDGEYPCVVSLSETHKVSCYRSAKEDDHG